MLSLPLSSSCKLCSDHLKWRRPPHAVVFPVLHSGKICLWFRRSTEFAIVSGSLEAFALSDTSLPRIMG